jgi:hypothetical protein
MGVELSDQNRHWRRELLLLVDAGNEENVLIGVSEGRVRVALNLTTSFLLRNQPTNQHIAVMEVPTASGKRKSNDTHETDAPGACKRQRTIPHSMSVSELNSLSKDELIQLVRSLQPEQPEHQHTTTDTTTTNTSTITNVKGLKISGLSKREKKERKKQLVREAQALFDISKYPQRHIALQVAPTASPRLDSTHECCATLILP